MEPLEIALEHAMEHALVAASLHWGERAPAVTRARVGAVRLVHLLPLLTRELRELAAQHPALPALLCYERYRMGWASAAGFFLEGVPRSIDVFGGAASLTLATDAVRKLRSRTAVNDRLKTVVTLETVARVRTGEVVRAHRPQDLHASIPICVAFFVGRLRAVAQSLQQTKPHLCLPCANANCGRTFYSGSAAEAWGAYREGGAKAGDELLDEADAETSTSYWDVAAGHSSVYSVATRRFCCSTCSDEHARHLRTALPAGFDLERDDALRGPAGRPRVALALRAALKRNELAARQLRVLGSLPKCAVSRVELATLAKTRVTALNVDVALLAAAARLAESDSLALGKRLPGARRGWRALPLYCKAVSRVAAIYKKTPRNGIVSSMLTQPQFLQVVLRDCLKVFG